MLDFSKIFKTFNSFIKARTNSNISVIQSRLTATKPIGVYATFDIISVVNATGYEMNRLVDNDSETVTQVTHKDITVRMSMRNSTPDNLENQMNTYSYITNLYNAFNTDSSIAYFDKALGASILSVGRVLSFNDTYPTGVASAQVFDAVIRIPDDVIEQVDFITDIEIVGLFDTILPPITGGGSNECGGVSLLPIPTQDIQHINISGNTVFKANNALIGKGNYELQQVLNENSLFEIVFTDTTERVKVELIGSDGKCIITNVNNILSVGDNVNNLSEVTGIIGVVITSSGLDLYSNGTIVDSFTVGNLTHFDLYVTNQDVVGLVFNKSSIRYKLPNTLDVCGNNMNG